MFDVRSYAGNDRCSRCNIGVIHGIQRKRPYVERFLCCLLCRTVMNMRNLYHIRVHSKWLYTTQHAIDRTKSYGTHKHSSNSMSCDISSFETFDTSIIACIEEHPFQAEVKLEDLLNLSILISKGKEINWDCLSNGEWTGKSSLLKRGKFTFDMHCSIWGVYCMVPVRVSSFDQGFNHRRC